MPRFRWENFTTANGLPDDRVFSVCVDGDRVWAGTENGLALYENGKWSVFTTADGLAHRAVLYVGAGQEDARRVDRHHGRAEPLLGRAASTPSRSSTAACPTTWSTASPCRATTSGWPPPRAAPPQHAHRPVEPSSTNATRPCTRSGLTPCSRRGGQGLLRGMGRRRAGVRRQDRALEGLQRSRRRDRDGAAQGPGADSRNHHFGELRRETRSCGWPLTSAPAATTAGTGTTSWRRTAAFPAIS